MLIRRSAYDVYTTLHYRRFNAVASTLIRGCINRMYLLGISAFQERQAIYKYYNPERCYPEEYDYRPRRCLCRKSCAGVLPNFYTWFFFYIQHVILYYRYKEIAYSYFMPVCGIVKTTARGAVDSSMHYCPRAEAEGNSTSCCPRYRGQ